MSNRTLISTINARRVWDSRGRPTLEAEVALTGGARGRAIAPAGASTGSGEAIDRRDGGEGLAAHDVTAALASIVQEIAPALCGVDATDQETLDAALIHLDGTANKARLGANACIAVSLAAAHAAAAAAHQPLYRYLAGDRPCILPLPEIQIFGGGLHAARRVDIQDFMVVCPGASSFAEALDWTAAIYIAAGRDLADQGKLQGVADEGGYWPAFASNEEGLALLTKAIEHAGFRPGDQVAIALDVAASAFGQKGLYRLALDQKTIDSGEMIALIESWVGRYPICSIEDPLAEDDEEGFVALTRRIGEHVQIVGDDLLVTDTARIHRAGAMAAVNAALIKPNQRGTLTETKRAFEAARIAGFDTIISARSGESEDVTVAHLAVGWSAGQLKVGGFCRSERMAKWNEVLRIAEQLDERSRFAGAAALRLRRR